MTAKNWPCIGILIQLDNAKRLCQFGQGGVKEEKGERLRLAGVGMLRLVGAVDLLLELILHFAQTHCSLHSAFQHQKLAAISTPELPVHADLVSWDGAPRAFGTALTARGAVIANR